MNDVPDAFNNAFEIEGGPLLVTSIGSTDESYAAPLTIDAKTMEVLSAEQSPLTFRSLREAETALEKLAGRENSIKLMRAKTLLAIRDQQLYKQAQDFETGEEINTFDAYLKDVCKRMVAFDGAMPRSLKDWMLKVRVYDEQMGLDDIKILRLGHHGTLMLQVAARSRTSGDLQDQDEDLNNGGGRRLGRAAFGAFVEEISEKVYRAQEDPSLVWTTAETEAEVNRILNKQKIQFSIEMKAVFVGDKVEVKDLTLWLNEVPIKIGDRIDLEDARMIPTSVQIEGLGENWR